MVKKEEEMIGEGIGKSEMEDLVPEWGWRRDDGSLFHRDQMKHNERSDRLYFYRGWCWWPSKSNGRWRQTW